MSDSNLIFKIVSTEQWTAAEQAGVFKGAAIDLQDGYIHFSDSEQLQETAAKHFAGQTGLLLVAVETGALGEDLKWEPSRGGALFPHLYGELKTDLALWVKELPWGSEGKHLFPDF